MIDIYSPCVVLICEYYYLKLMKGIIVRTRASYYSRFTKNYSAIIWNIFYNNTIGSNSCIVANMDIPNDFCPSTNENIVANNWCSFLFGVKKVVGADCDLLKDHTILSNYCPTRNKNAI